MRFIFVSMVVLVGLGVCAGLEVSSDLKKKEELLSKYSDCSDVSTMASGIGMPGGLYWPLHVDYPEATHKCAPTVISDLYVWVPIQVGDDETPADGVEVDQSGVVIN